MKAGMVRDTLGATIHFGIYLTYMMDKAGRTGGIVENLGVLRPPFAQEVE